MEITVYGAGYVGLVTGLCLADAGNHVLVVDVNEEKIHKLQQGVPTIHESGIEPLLKDTLSSNNIRFTTSHIEGVAFGQYQIIAVDTPSNPDGTSNTKNVLNIAERMGALINEKKVVIVKSTVPVGTTDKVKSIIEEGLNERAKTLPVTVVFNPEFLKEGVAISDFQRPDRIIIGIEAGQPSVEEKLKLLFAPFNRNHNRLMFMDTRSAELTKYTANAMLATKISFINEISLLADELGADIEQVRLGIGADPRIGYDFIYAGCGYGGSCFPKDLDALNTMMRQADIEPLLISAVQSINVRQMQAFFSKIKQYFNHDLTNKRIALWGLSFKPGTDDIREAPSHSLMEALWKAGATVMAYDPIAMPACKLRYGNHPELLFCDSANHALEDADALVIVTEWREFRSPDFTLIREKLKNPVIFDGRNIYDVNELREVGITYYGIGRSNVNV